MEENVLVVVDRLDGGPGRVFQARAETDNPVFQRLLEKLSPCPVEHTMNVDPEGVWWVIWKFMVEEHEESFVETMKWFLIEQ